MSLITGIDHVIIAVEDLGKAGHLYSSMIGLHVSGGGTHPDHGTSNRIIVLHNEYIELLSITPGVMPRGVVGHLAAQRQGIVACILGTDDPAGLQEWLVARGCQTSGPTRGTLDAGPEYSRSWTTVTPISPTLPGLPFFIRHDTEGQERSRLLHGSAGKGSHAIGATVVASVTFAVHGALASASACAEMLRLDLGRPYMDEMLEAHCETVVLPDRSILVFAAPLPDRPRGSLGAALDRFGEGAFAMTLAVRDLPGAVSTLRGRGIGVRVDEPEGVLIAAQLNFRQLGGARLGLVASH